MNPVVCYTRMKATVKTFWFFHKTYYGCGINHQYAYEDLKRNMPENEWKIAKYSINSIALDSKGKKIITYPIWTLPTTYNDTESLYENHWKHS